MTKQHKWHKEIKAWADGAEIEYKANDGNWYSCDDPLWSSASCKYRIKLSNQIDKNEALKIAISQFERINNEYPCEEIIDICKEALKDKEWDTQPSEFWKEQFKPQPKEQQYLYVYEHLTLDKIFCLENQKSCYGHIGEYIGKIKLETEETK